MTRIGMLIVALALTTTGVAIGAPTLTSTDAPVVRVSDEEVEPEEPTCEEYCDVDEQSCAATCNSTDDEDAQSECLLSCEEQQGVCMDSCES